MKKICTALITVGLLLLCGVTAYAETSVTITHGDPEAVSAEAITVDWTAVDADFNNDTPDADNTGTGGYAAVPVRDVSAEESLSPVFYPLNVETVTENGVLLIKKTYEVSPDVDPQLLVQPFEHDGHSFVSREILRRQLSGETQTRAASKTAIFDSGNDDKAEILKQFPSTVDHEENGYAGELHLDASSIVTEADSYETYTYAYTKTKEFPGLDRNDPAYIDRQWNGMVLANVSFKQDAGGRYTGVASYTGTATGKRPTSYVTTATYYGEITKTEPGNVLYTVIYEGVAAELPAESAEPEILEQDMTEQESTAQGESEKPVSGGITLFHIALTGLAGILLGGVLILKFEPLLQRVFHNENKEEKVE